MLRPVGAELAVEGEDVALRVPLSQIEIGEPLAHAERILVLPDGERCEVEPGPALDLLLDVLGHREGRISRWQGRWSHAFGAALVVLILLLGSYRWGVPWLSQRISREIPAEWVNALGARTLESLDELIFEPTQLATADCERLAHRLATLRAPAGEVPDHTLHFRAAGKVPNAFALPGGEIVVTDALVELAASDEEVLGVLAHELGHLHERHALRSLIQSSFVGALVALWLGDVTALGTGLPAAVLEARYSRDFEREADAYAAAILRASSLDARPLAELLARLQARHGPEGEQTLSGYLSSHPATSERIRALARDEDALLHPDAGGREGVAAPQNAGRD